MNEFGSFWRLEASGSATLKERRSEFLACSVPVTSVEQAQAELETIKRQQHSATHNCWAWRLDPLSGGQENCSDDGEPTGTAGRAILGALARVDLWDGLVVVSRYFGGVKLGPRGLIEAYGAAAASAINSAPRTLFRAVRRLILLTTYEKASHLAGSLCQMGLGAPQSDYGLAVTMQFDVPLKMVAPVTKWLSTYEVQQTIVGEPRWDEIIWQKIYGDEQQSIPSQS